MNAAREWSRVRAVVWKDLTAERRARANFNAVVAFAGLVLVLFGVALGPDAEAVRRKVLALAKRCGLGADDAFPGR